MGYHEKDNANSTQDLNDAGSKFRQCSNEFWFSNMDFSNYENLMKIVNAKFKSKIQVAEELQAKRGLTMLTGRQPLARTTCGTMSCETAT